MESTPRSRIKYGLILSVLFGLLALGLLVWLVAISSDLGTEQEARIAAEAAEERERAARRQAETVLLSAETRAQNAVTLKATAEANLSQVADDASAAEQRAEQQSQLRATAEAERREAEADTRAAEQRAELATQALATAEAERAEAERNLTDLETQPPDEQPGVEKATALRLARTSPTLLAIATGELRFFVDPLPDYAAGGVDDAVADIVEALEDLDLYGASIMQTSVEAEADILVKWARDYDDHILGLAINQTVINVGLGSTNCLGSWQAFDAETVRRILWHEFGHTFGYSHSADPTNIMYPTTDTRFAVDEEIERVLAPGSYWEIPICLSGTYTFSFENENSENEFRYAVLPLAIDAEDYLDYPDLVQTECEAGLRRRFWEECEVQVEERLLIYNPHEDDPLPVSGQIEDLTPRASINTEWDPEGFFYEDETIDYYLELFAEE